MGYNPAVTIASTGIFLAKEDVASSTLVTRSSPESFRGWSGCAAALAKAGRPNGRSYKIFLCICGAKEPKCSGLKHTKTSFKTALTASWWSYASPDASVWKWKLCAARGATRLRCAKNLAAASRCCRAIG